MADRIAAWPPCAVRTRIPKSIEIMVPPLPVGNTQLATAARAGQRRASLVAARSNFVEATEKKEVIVVPKAVRRPIGHG